MDKLIDASMLMQTFPVALLQPACQFIYICVYIYIFYFLQMTISLK